MLCYSFYKVKKKKKNLFIRGRRVSSAGCQLCFICRQDKDSKDEAAKAEKELEEIRKVIEDSGGKLSSRVLQCDVRKQGHTQDSFFFSLIDDNDHYSTCHDYLLFSKWCHEKKSILFQSP